MDISDALRAFRNSARSDSTGAELVRLAFNANEAVTMTLDALLDAGARGRVPAKMQRAAWLQVCHALWKGVRTMNRFSEQCLDPQVFGFARTMHSWPVNRSPGAGFQETEPEERELFTRLGLGEDMPVSVIGTKWKHTDPAGKVALELWHAVHNRQLVPIECTGEAPEAEQRFRERASGLRGFREPDAWKQWWALAEEEIVPRWWNDPVKRGELESLVTAKSKRKSPGRLRTHLSTMLKDRFRSMAGANKY